MELLLLFIQIISIGFIVFGCVVILHRWFKYTVFHKANFQVDIRRAVQATVYQNSIYGNLNYLSGTSDHNIYVDNIKYEVGSRFIDSYALGRYIHPADCCEQHVPAIVYNNGHRNPFYCTITRMTWNTIYFKFDGFTGELDVSIEAFRYGFTTGSFSHISKGIKPTKYISKHSFL